jgi:ribosomal protein S18 acetylase RimI-like enzyme
LSSEANVARMTVPVKNQAATRLYDGFGFLVCR